jgi:2-dehydro-3-deoxyphosphooctonate aldolase (KDO 8-P synthase)
MIPFDLVQSFHMTFQIQSVTIGGPELFLIAGPCVIESEEHALKMAAAISAVARQLGIPYIFKASYDKANRTSLASFRGPGLKRGLAILRKVAECVKVPVLTDVHEPAQVDAVAEAVDVLQIPAFLCRQTDLLVAAAKSGRAINIKKGQFVAPWDMRHAVAKVRESGNDRVFLTERGAAFGYNNLVVDMRSLAIMREFAPVVFDATHSVQLPSAGSPSGAESSAADGKSAQSVSDKRSSLQGGVERGVPDTRSSSRGGVESGGQPQFIPLLSRAAVAAGVDGIFMEVHDNPREAKSDGANALDLKLLRPTLEELLRVHQAVSPR